MPIMRYPKCWRGRADCEPFQAIDATDVDPETLTEEQMYNLDYPVSGYVCCGCIDAASRKLPQDAYRLCFVTPRGVDDLTENDEQDLTHLNMVISHALAVIATRRVNSGKIDVLTEDGIEPVETKQGS